MPEAFCVKDRKIIEIKNPKTTILKNKVLAQTGTCPICGREVYRFVKRHIDPIHALNIAIEREKEAQQFYRDAANNAEDSNGSRRCCSGLPEKRCGIKQVLRSN
ncbi:DUF5679 domain-containing protein [Chloroflexota bacterium]